MAAITSFQPGGYPGRPYGSFAGRVPAATATVSGTATTGITEVEYRTSSKVILIDIANDTLEVGATFDAARAAVLAGITSNSGIFIANQVVGTVVRTSDTRITITLAADPLYDISSTDTITVTVPESVLVTSISDVLATPTFTVTAVAVPAVVTEMPGSGGTRKRKKAKVIRYSDFSGREEYEKALREQIAESGLVSKKLPATPKEIEAAVVERIGKRSAQMDTAIKVSQEVLQQLQDIRDDDEAMLLMLMMMAVK